MLQFPVVSSHSQQQTQGTYTASDLPGLPADQSAGDEGWRNRDVGGTDSRQHRECVGGGWAMRLTSMDALQGVEEGHQQVHEHGQVEGDVAPEGHVPGAPVQDGLGCTGGS